MIVDMQKLEHRERDADDSLLGGVTWGLGKNESGGGEIISPSVLEENKLEKQTRSLLLQIDTPLRAFLRNVHNNTAPRWAADGNIASLDLDLLALTPSHSCGKKMDEEMEIDKLYVRGNNRENNNQSTSALGLDETSLEDQTCDGHTSCVGLPALQCSNTVLEEHCSNQHMLLPASCSTFPKEIIMGMEPTPVLPSSPKKKKRRQTRNSSTEDRTRETQSLIQSFDTLNKLMERTASTRCLLLQQTETCNKPTSQLMRSLSASAFKTIVSSTNITSSTSAASFRNSTAVPNTPANSNPINSSFNETIEDSIQKLKKRRLASNFRPLDFVSNLQRPKSSSEVQQITRGSLNSLPSCGSLTSSSSESVRSFKRVIQRYSLFPEVEFSGQIQMNRKFNDVHSSVGKKTNVLRVSMMRNSVPSCGSLNSNTSLGSVRSFKRVIQTLSSSTKDAKSSSLQMNGRLNNCEGPLANKDFLPCNSALVNDSNGDPIPLVFKTHCINDRKEAAEKISHAMKLKLRRELQRTTTKIGFPNCSGGPRLSNAAA